MLRIAATADLHGHLPEILPSDILCICGDIFPPETDDDVQGQGRWFEETFLPWIDSLPVPRTVLVGGNHDTFLEKESAELLRRFGDADAGRLVYLCGTSADIAFGNSDSVTVFGTPYSPLPVRHTAFCGGHRFLADKFPVAEMAAADIILTHTPPCGIGGLGVPAAEPDIDLGCRELTQALHEVQNIPPPEGRAARVLFCGHIHQASHSPVTEGGMTLLNVALTDNSKARVYPPAYISLGI